jgi:nucleotide-binding universal stress UspA family protein
MKLILLMILNCFSFKLDLFLSYFFIYNFPLFLLCLYMKNNKSNNTKNNFNRILVPVDGSDLSKKAAKIACSLAEKLKKDVIFFHVMDVPAEVFPPQNETYNPAIDEALRKQGSSILNSFKDECKKSGINIETRLVEGIPDDEIISEAKKDDLIIMGSKGQSAIERIFIGSVTEKVMHHTIATVMIVR